MNFEEFTKKWEVRQDSSLKGRRFFNRELGVFPENINTMLEDFCRAVQHWGKKETEISYTEILFAKIILVLAAGGQMESLSVFNETHAHIWECLVEYAKQKEQKEEE